MRRHAINSSHCTGRGDLNYTRSGGRRLNNHWNESAKSLKREKIKDAVQDISQSIRYEISDT